MRALHLQAAIQRKAVRKKSVRKEIKKFAGITFTSCNPKKGSKERKREERDWKI